MQPLNGGLRSHLTADQVRAVIESPSRSLSVACDAIDVDTLEVSSVSSVLASPAPVVEHDADADIRHTFTATFTEQLAWQRIYLAPRVTLSAGGVDTVWRLGVYAPVEVRRTGTPGRARWEVFAHDRTSRLVWSLGAARRVEASSSLLAEVSSIIADAQQVTTDPIGVSIPGDDTLAARAHIWLSRQGVLPALRQLLRAAGFEPLATDPSGRFTSRAAQSPATRPVEYEYRGGLAELRRDAQASSTLDLRTPNRWVFSWRPGPGRAEPVTGAGLYQVDNVSTGPTSQNATGQIRSEEVEVDAETHAVLVQLGDRHVAAALGADGLWDVSTMLHPAHWDGDIVSAPDLDGVPRKVAVDGWRMTLAAGAPMTHRWRRVIEGGSL